MIYEFSEHDSVQFRRRVIATLVLCAEECDAVELKSASVVLPLLFGATKGCTVL